MTSTRLGHFRILSKLADSDSGEVYRAEDESLRRQVVLEVLSPASASDPDHKARFLKAARAAAAVTHPNIAAIHEAGESEGCVWMARELVEGTSLRSRLRGRPLPLLEVLNVGEQVAEGLGAAHDAGLTHGDLDPDRVLVGPGGQVKVLELGLAGRRPEPGDTGAAVDPRADVRRLGAMLYEMATGRAPAAADMREMPVAGPDARATASGTIPPSTLNPEVPAELDRIIGACLEPDPDDRYPRGGAVAADLARLRRWIESATVRGSGGTPATRLKPAWSARRIAAWSAAAVLVMAAGLAGWQWVSPRLLPPAPFKTGDRFIVADFVNETGDIELGTALVGNLQLGLVDYVSLQALPRELMRDLSSLDAAAAEARCLKGECEGYFTGSVVGDEKRYLLAIALNRVGRPQPVVALSAATDADTMGETLDRMMRDFARILHERWGVEKPDQAWGTGREFPTYCPALMGGESSVGVNMLKGWMYELRAQFEEGGSERITLRRQGLEIDPTNPTLHWFLGAQLWRGGRRGEGLRHMKEGQRLLEKQVEGHPECRWYALQNEIIYLGRSWDYDTQAERLNRAVQLFPNHPGMWKMYADVTEAAMGDPASGLPYIRKAWEVSRTYEDQGADYFTVLTRALMRANRMDEVDALIEEYRALPLSPDGEEERGHRIARARLEANIARGQDHAATLDEIERLASEGAIGKGDARHLRTDFLARAGRVAEAEALGLEARAEATTRALMSGVKPGGSYDLLDLLAQRRSGEVRELEPVDLEGSLRTDASLVSLARWSVDLGTASALREALRTIAEEQKDIRSRRVRNTIQFGRGCQALIEGKASEAVALLEPLGREYGAAALLNTDEVLGRAYEVLGRWADAAGSYERMLADPVSRELHHGSGYVKVLDQQRLAGIHERLGNTERARYWYGRFLHDWRNADPGMPEVEDAKRRLAQLGGPLPEGLSQGPTGGPE